MELVSIITPFFNASKTIKETLKSILNQKYEQFECILINDYSTDETILIVQDFINIDKRFKLFNNDKKGVVNARNYGLKKAKGRFIAFLDSDDIWHPSFLEESMLIREKMERPISITHSSFFKFKYNRNKIDLFLINSPQIVNKAMILKKNFLPLLTVVIDRNLINSIYFEDIRPEDYNLWLKLIYFKRYESISIDKPLAYYRISKKQRSKNKIKSLLRIYKLFSKLPNANITSILFNTLNWIIFNIFERIKSKKIKDGFHHNYLKEI
tara:strand:- start:197 stop:1000 length:804 start_codon:yes stop_codon:yes gene_type:complete